MSRGRGKPRAGWSFRDNPIIAGIWGTEQDGDWWILLPFALFALVPLIQMAASSW